MARMTASIFRKDQKWMVALVSAISLILVSFSSMLMNVQPVQAAAVSGFTATYSDADGNGTVDTITVVLNGGEVLTTCTVTDAEVATDWTYVGNDIGGSLASSGETHSCVLGTETITLKLTGANANVTGHSTAPTLAYDNDDADDSLINATATVANIGATAAVDGAAPVVVSVGPADGHSAAAVSSNIGITFSEAMDTTFDESTEFTVSPDPGTFTETWSAGNTVVSLDSDTGMLCSTTYTVTTAEASIDAAAGSPTGLVTTGPEDGDWSFTTRCGGTASPAAPKTWEVTVDSPDGGESYMPLERVDIEWTTGGTGAENFVNLYYSTDGGITLVLIESGMKNVNTYSWKIPAGVNSDDVTVVVEITDLAVVLAEDSSNNSFSVIDPAMLVITEPDEPLVVTEPENGHIGVSPLTGKIESISVVNAGDYIRGLSFDTVYYIDGDMKRHPFIDRQTYFTHQNSFKTVKVVTNATLSTFAIGTPMLPKHEVVLVKVQSVKRVYALEYNSDDPLSPKLRWITAGEVARGIYGDNWADYVIDIPPTSFSRFSTGEDINSSKDITVDVSVMRKRVNLNS